MVYKNIYAQSFKKGFEFVAKICEVIGEIALKIFCVFYNCLFVGDNCIKKDLFLKNKLKK